MSSLGARTSTFRYLTIAAIATLLLTAGVNPAMASVEPSPSSDLDAYEIQLGPQSEQPAQIRDLLDVANSVNGELHFVRFEGEEGVGELMVAPGVSDEELHRQAVNLFERVGTEVPPITAAIVFAERGIDSDLLATNGLEAAVQPVEENASSFEVLNGASQPYSATPSGTVGEVPYAATALNDWSPFFPSDWRAEGFNMNRCTNYSGGVCRSSIQAASLTQNVRWMDDHRPNLWPSASFGLEFGIALKNYSLCDDNPESTPGYWLNPDYYEWSTGVPASAVPYLDTNRLSDACESLSHELGVRYPSGLIAGATYGFTLTTRRNIYNSSSTYDASFQAVFDDCAPLGLGTSTDCMWLTNPSFPWGQRSATVVNTSRYFSFPRCARMHDKWSAPIQWSNGSSRAMPAPLNFSDSCFSNSWY